MAHGRKDCATAARQKDPAKIVQVGARRRCSLINIATATTNSQNVSGGVAASHASVTCNGRAACQISSMHVYSPSHTNASPSWMFADESSTLTHVHQLKYRHCPMHPIAVSRMPKPSTNAAQPAHCGPHSRSVLEGGGIPARPAPGDPRSYNIQHISKARAQHRPITGPLWAMQIEPHAQDRPQNTPVETMQIDPCAPKQAPAQNGPKITRFGQCKLSGTHKTVNKTARLSRYKIKPHTQNRH